MLWPPSSELCSLLYSLNHSITYVGQCWWLFLGTSHLINSSQVGMAYKHIKIQIMMILTDQLQAGGAVLYLIKLDKPHTPCLHSKSVLRNLMLHHHRVAITFTHCYLVHSQRARSSARVIGLSTLNPQYLIREEHMITHCTLYAL